MTFLKGQPLKFRTQTRELKPACKALKKVRKEGNVQLACVASVSVRVRQENRDERKDLFHISIKNDY